MKLFWAILFSLSFLSCTKTETIEPGTYLLYDLLDDSLFYAIEKLNDDGSGEFQELNIYEGDTCTLGTIKFHWKFIQNRIVYENQKYSEVVDCEKKQEPEPLDDQFYTILEKGENYFVAKTMYKDSFSPLDSSIVLWKKTN